MTTFMNIIYFPTIIMLAHICLEKPMTDFELNVNSIKKKKLLHRNTNTQYQIYTGTIIKL